MRLPDDDPEAFALLVEWLYSRNLNKSIPTGTKPRAPAIRKSVARQCKRSSASKSYGRYLYFSPAVSVPVLSAQYANNPVSFPASKVPSPIQDNSTRMVMEGPVDSSFSNPNQSLSKTLYISDDHLRRSRHFQEKRNTFERNFSRATPRYILKPEKKEIETANLKQLNLLKLGFFAEKICWMSFSITQSQPTCKDGPISSAGCLTNTSSKSTSTLMNRLNSEPLQRIAHCIKLSITTHMRSSSS